MEIPGGRAWAGAATRACSTCTATTPTAAMVHAHCPHRCHICGVLNKHRGTWRPCKGGGGSTRICCTCSGATSPPCLTGTWRDIIASWAVTIRTAAKMPLQVWGGVQVASLGRAQIQVRRGPGEGPCRLRAGYTICTSGCTPRCNTPAPCCASIKRGWWEHTTAGAASAPVL